MLEWMQKHKKYLVVTVWVSALALIFASMVEWGGGGFSAASYDSVAKVGDSYISYQEYQKRYYDIYNQMKQIYDIGDDGNKMLPEIEQIVFKELVQEKLLELLARDWGVYVTPNEVLSKLMTIPDFQDVNHNFDKNKYLTLLETNGRKAQEYEEFVAKVTLNEKMQNFPISPISSLEINSFLSASKIKDDILFDILDKQSVLKNVSIQLSDDKIREYWERNKDKYAEPKKYGIAYIAINLDDIKTDGDSLVKYHKENSKQYRDMSFDNVKDDVMKDYQKAIINISNLYLSNISKGIDNIDDSEYGKVIYAIDSNSISLLQNYLDNDLDVNGIKKGDIPLHYIQLVDDNSETYAILLEQVKKAKKGDVLSPIEYTSNQWIIPLVVDEIQEKILTFEQARDMVYKDLMLEEEDREFKRNVQTRFANIKSETMRYNVSVSYFDLQLADKSDLYKKFIEIGLNTIHMRDFIDKIMNSDKLEGFIFLDSDHAVLYKIVNQSMPSYSELTNASNNEINMLEEAKIRDFRNALIEYATSRYKIIDYRRQN